MYIIHLVTNEKSNPATPHQTARSIMEKTGGLRPLHQRLDHLRLRNVQPVTLHLHKETYDPGVPANLQRRPTEDADCLYPTKPDIRDESFDRQLRSGTRTCSADHRDQYRHLQEGVTTAGA